MQRSRDFAAIEMGIAETAAAALQQQCALPGPFQVADRGLAIFLVNGGAERDSEAPVAQSPQCSTLTANRRGDSAKAEILSRAWALLSPRNRAVAADHDAATLAEATPHPRVNSLRLALRPGRG